MRTKLSITADGTYRNFAPPAHAASGFFSQDAGIVKQNQASPRPLDYGLQRADRTTQAVSADVRGEGLLHDARNLVSAIGLYCDLLLMPGVLRPEHQQYPEELRLLGTRSRVLIERLMLSLVSQSLSNRDKDSSLIEHTLPEAYAVAGRRIHGAQPNSRTPESGERVQQVSLRTTIERCSGLLTGVASGRPIEVTYGAAADVPVWISEEAIERILVNLVRNASQALDQEPHTSPAHADTDQQLPHTGSRSIYLTHRRYRHPGTSSLPGSRSAIRISVGSLVDRIGKARSWPFQRVRLVVEDSGCGMEQKQLHSLLCRRMAESRGTHGIGFRVVRELVAASNGDLRAASTPGIGTRVQIEWPVAATSTAEEDGALMQRKRELASTLKSPTIERRRRSIPAVSQPSAIVEGRQRVN